MANRIYNFKGDSYSQPILETLHPSSGMEEYESHLADNLPGGAKLNTMVSENKEYPWYDSQYSTKVNDLLTSMENRGGFSYDANSDPVYQAYRKQYLREGQRATQNTLAQTSAMTGGRPSSYAVTAAAQQGNYYNSQLTDKIPELYQQAYNRYLQEFQNQAQMAQLYQQQDQNEYNRFSQDRSFDYNARQDQISNLMKNRELAYNQMSTDRAFNYQQEQDRIANMQRQEQNEFSNFMQMAQMALQVGDYSQLKAMGFDTSRSGFASDLQVATLIAQYTGDTSMLRSLMGKG